jgi:predicted amidophosphoribosyltransferase
MTKVVFVSNYHKNLRCYILEAKLNDNPYICKLLALKLVLRLHKEKFIKYVDVIVPVASSKKLAEITAKILSRAYRKKISLNNLVKTGQTFQHRLKKTHRFWNTKGAYLIKRPHIFYNKKVLLVDDVLTTGKTADECIKLIKKCGAKRVYLAVLAKTEKFL